MIAREFFASARKRPPRRPWSSLLRMPASVCRPARRSVCSKLSSPPSPMVWVSAWRSAARSSKRMEGRCGHRPIVPAAACFGLRCLRQILCLSSRGGRARQSTKQRHGDGSLGQYDRLSRPGTPYRPN